ncbi:MAG: transcription elongation factor GreA [Lachnospiraceae bacterium]|jgi:transcription elongation factor GreA|nr:transcription elongation factor GreA [Lachnospiraceae bacterium]MCI1727055.1 transcription elongation factor GreA [Lachnospiraceae bacterium]
MYDKLTKSDIDKMQKEIEDRKLVQRPKLIQAVKEARAQGDLSENFEYHAARREKGLNDSRIAYLENMIKTATIIEDEPVSEDTVALNKSVKVMFTDNKDTADYRIVTTIRGNSLKGLISIDSPVGKALLGHKAGDTVHVQVNPQAGYDLQIMEVGTAEDDSSDEIKSF